MDKLARSSFAWIGRHPVLVFSALVLIVAIIHGARQVAQFDAQPFYRGMADRYRDENNIDAFNIGLFEVLLGLWLPGLAIILIYRLIRRR